MSVYCVSDLHGQYDLYKQIKSILKPADIVYCLGDSGDRGPQPWQTLKACLEDPQFIYIKGNHDDMLVKAYKEYLSWDGEFGSPLYSLLRYNGGEDTLQELLGEEDACGYITLLEKIPLNIVYTNLNGKRCLLTHAGCTPQENELHQLVFNNDNVYLCDRHSHDYISNNILWDRDHFYDCWLGPDDVIVVHGHTNVWSVRDEVGDDIMVSIPAEYWYCNDHKCCIDRGSYVTGEAVLLNLDDFSSQVFKVRK